MNIEIIKQKITSVLQRESETPIDFWYIGITNNTARRQKEHLTNYPQLNCWNAWKADSVVDAEKIENWGINELGLDGHAGRTEEDTHYVYIFRTFHLY